MRKINLKESLSYIKKHQAIIKERLVFISIFLVITLPLSIILVKYSSQEQDLSERSMQEQIQKAYSLFESALLQDLSQENSRSYADYGTVKNARVIGGNVAQLSGFFTFPDSVGPFCGYDPNYHCTKGLIGHFQISPRGELQTPFYPDTNYDVGRAVWNSPEFDLRDERKKTRDQIQHLLDTLGIKNSQPMTQMIDSTEAIDEVYAKMNETEHPVRIETSSEDEANAYIAETYSANAVDHYNTPTHLEVNIYAFQSKFVNDTLVFYRRVDYNMVPRVQGIAIDMYRYLNHVVQNKLKEFNNPSYAISITFGQQVIATMGDTTMSNSKKETFRLAKPYDQVLFTIYASQAGNLRNQLPLILGIILLIVIAAALWTIYRFTQSKIALATKRQDFVSAITHELKTPLTAIKMYAELLQNSWVVSDEKRQKYYNQIASEADRLSRLIQNVLNLSKLDGNRWNVQLRRERPKAVLDDFVSTYSKNVEKQGFELTVSSATEADNIALLIDRDAIMQILMNLVDNSLKFSKKSDYKMINIELAIKGTDMYLAVRDFGPGIPPAEMKKVFQEFYRVENEMTRQTSGTGIGLSMVKKLCTLTNLKIEVENANPGLRTKIHFPPLDI